MERFQKMRRSDALVILAHGNGLRGLDEPARAIGKFLEVHVVPVLPLCRGR